MFYVFFRNRRPPISTHTDTLYPYPTLLRYRDADPSETRRYVCPHQGLGGHKRRRDPAAESHRRQARRPARDDQGAAAHDHRSEEHTSELQSLMRITYAVFCVKNKKAK